MENLVSVADRLQWAINLGQEHDASPYQRALLSYIAFRSGPENAGAWPSREKISRDTGMHENTITRVLSWWVDRGVLHRTRRHHSSTTYQLQESEHHRGALTMADAQIGEPQMSAAQSCEPARSGPDKMAAAQVNRPNSASEPATLANSAEVNRPPRVSEPDRELDDANCQNTTEVLQEHHAGVSRTPQECSKNTTEVPIKEPERNKENEQEKDNTSTVIRELREYLDNCPDAERSKAIKDALGYWPDWWAKRPEEATSYYLENWGKFTDEVLARSDTQEVEVDPADRGRLRWGQRN